MQILGVLRDLYGDESGDNETKRDNDNYEDCVSLIRQKVTFELSGPFAKFGAPHTDNDSSNPPENFHKKKRFYC